MGRDKKIVIFGAGKIGRSFIGQVFGCAGYRVVFVDIDEELVAELNRTGEYRVVIRGNDGEEVITVRNISAVLLGDKQAVLNELAGTTLAAVSVGQQGLPGVINILAPDLLSRHKRSDKPLDLIIAENMRNADDYIRGELRKILPAGFPVGKMAGLVETSIGRMVPIMSDDDIRQDPLQVFAEPYNSLIVARRGFLNPLPEVPQLSPKENIKAWVDRKLMIHNLGHAATAYFGYASHPEKIYIWEVLENPAVYGKVRSTMLEAAAVLMAIHPGEFTEADLGEHIDDLLRRFRNCNLGDTVYRAGCDLYRKLGPEDRLAAPIRAAVRLHKPYGNILDAVVSAISFRAKDAHGNYHPSDVRFFDEAARGTAYVLREICGLPPSEHHLHSGK